MTLITDSVADSYDRGWKAYVKAWSRVHPWLSQERQEFIGRLKPSSMILDVGCGPGNDTAWFQEHGFDALGIDISPKMVAWAKSQHPNCRFELIDALRIDLQTERFDGIWISYAILHIEKSRLAEFVESLAKILAPGGLVCLTTSTNDLTSEGPGIVSGLEDSEGNGISVYYVTWNPAELRSAFERFFKEVWHRDEVEAPTGRRSMSVLWKLSKN